MLKQPGVVHDDPAPKPKAVGTCEDASATANRLAPDAAAVRRVDDINEERKAKVQGLHLVFSFMRHISASNPDYFFSLGSESRKRFLQSYPHVDLRVISFKEL